MKVVVTSSGEGLDSQVDPRFGRAAQFILVDTETGVSRAVENSAGVAAAQGAGVQGTRRGVRRVPDPPACGADGRRSDNTERELRGRTPWCSRG